MRTLVRSLAVLVLAASALWAEPYFVSVSATQTVQSVSLPVYTQTIILVSDGASTCYFRLFTDVDTAGNATTASAALKSGEALTYTFLAPQSPTTAYPGGVRDRESYNSAGARARYYRSMSVICAAGQTATWRVYAK